MALTGLAVTVVGCGGDRSTARKWCKAYQECEKAAFEEQYSSMQDCIDEGVEDLEDLEDDTDKDCAAAYRKMLECGAKAYRQDCDLEDSYDECEDEYEDMEDECYDD